MVISSWGPHGRHWVLDPIDAGAIVVTEAGGVVTDAGANPLDFSKGRYLDLDTGIIVTNPKLMPMLLKAVRKSLDEKLHPCDFNHGLSIQILCVLLSIFVSAFAWVAFDDAAVRIQNSK
ncbi:hypothetical protein RHMOL_Rhmol09G0273400 [Rhododendron molle]|uniref:Uncharacterized protein n=1 Tax=Rhododendron molle TaxID=49168 RepID=A0ACC0MI92_RHOML|nr:hypothetical protein RHMOL_Rhmol09G0273400 [Rhododendron molle]